MNEQEARELVKLGRIAVGLLAALAAVGAVGVAVLLSIYRAMGGLSGL